MDMHKANNILTVCKKVAEMPSGEGWVRSSDIVTWSAVPHATTYRYLTKLVKLGYLKVKTEAYRKATVRHYTITDAGMGYCDGFRGLF